MLKAFVELINIVHQKQQVEFPDWNSIISYINRNQSILLVDVNDVPTAFEKDQFDKTKLLESRKQHFGDTPTEALLYKYCLNYKDIKLILQFLFSVYNFVKDLRSLKKTKRAHHPPPNASIEKHYVKTKNVSLLGSAEPKRPSRQNYSPMKVQSTRASLKSHRKEKPTRFTGHNMNSFSPNKKDNKTNSPGIICILMSIGKKNTEANQRKERIMKMTQELNEDRIKPAFELAKSVAENLPQAKSIQNMAARGTRNSNFSESQDSLFRFSGASFKGK